MLLRGIKAPGGRCALVLDEVERVSDPACVDVLNVLIRRAPATRHVAMACRELPAGLDVSGPAFGGDAQLVTTDDLCFSCTEIDRFFHGRLSRRERAVVTADSAGWPIALRIRYSLGEDVAGESGRIVLRSTAHAVRAFLFANATAARLPPRRCSTPTAHRLRRSWCRLARCSAGRTPWISSVRR